MARYQIECVTLREHHRHIVMVKYREDDGIVTAQVGAVRTRMRTGDEFYTVSPSTEAEAAVEPYDCECGYQSIRSSSDAVEDNNLDNMECPSS